METKEFLKQIISFQEKLAKRGYELIMANGCDIILYETVDHIEFWEEEVSLLFTENTRHDCPDSKATNLTIADIEMSDSDWNDFIKNRTEETLRNIEKAKQNTEKQILQQKEETFERLKIELGKS